MKNSVSPISTSTRIDLPAWAEKRFIGTRTLVQLQKLAFSAGDSHMCIVFNKTIACWLREFIALNISRAFPWQTHLLVEVIVCYFLYDQATGTYTNVEKKRAIGPEGRITKRTRISLMVSDVISADNVSMGDRLLRDRRSFLLNNMHQRPCCLMTEGRLCNTQDELDKFQHIHKQLILKNPNAGYRASIALYPRKDANEDANDLIALLADL